MSNDGYFSEGDRIQLTDPKGKMYTFTITAGKEFLTEGAEGSQEQIAQNLALQRQGFDVPTFRGAVSQGVLEGLAGAGMGGTGGVREAYKAKQEVAGLTDEDKGTAVKDVFTTTGTDKRAKAPQATQEQLDLMEAATAIGTETPAPPTDTTATAPATDLQAKAQAYIDEGKPNTFKAKNLVKELGLDVPAGKGFNERAIEAIKTYLGQGAPSGTDNVPSGASPGVDESANPPTDVAGTPSNPPGDMGGTGAAIPPGATGAKVEFGALSPETQETISSRRDAFFDAIDDGESAKIIKNKLKELKLYLDDNKYAGGGEVPNQDKMFQLPLEMVIYVPSTQDVDKVISVDKMDKRVDEVKIYLANKFGPCDHCLYLF